MSSFQNAALFITTLFSGLIAGLLYSYSCSVNIGLKALPDEGYLKAMQSINAAIQNPCFFICFIGLLLFFPLACWVSYTHQQTTSFYLLTAAALLYFITVFGTTVFGNIPLNNQLEKFDILNTSQSEKAAMRFLFENAWNKFHLIRTVSAVISFGFTILALFKLKS